MSYQGFRDLTVYQRAFALAIKIHELTSLFPKEERFSLSDQVRRSSRSIVANLAEAWAKRQYPKSFVCKLCDALGEEHETESWVDFSYQFSYINEKQHQEMMLILDEIRKMLISMIRCPEKFCR